MSDNNDDTNENHKHNDNRVIAENETIDNESEVKMTRWNNICDDMEYYWQVFTLGNEDAMNNIISKFKNFYGYGEDFDAKYFGEIDMDEIEYHEEENGIWNEPNDLIENYYGNMLRECCFCHGATNGDDILEERMLDNWQPPMCELCFNIDNRPCCVCHERVCECESINRID